MGYYITKQGDTWDKIAFEVYGDELYTSYLQNENRKLIDIFVFPSGIKLDIPVIKQTEIDVPDWRT